MSTTYESLYKRDFDEACNTYKTKMLQPLDTYRDLPTVSTDIVVLLTNERELLHKIEDLGRVNIPTFTYDVKGQLDKHFDKLDLDNINQRKMIQEECEQKKEEAQREYEELCNNQHQHNADLINPYREKHEQLLEYKDDLKRTCDRYGISPLDMNISDNITLDEFEALIDTSLSICEKYQSREYGYFAKAIAPLKDTDNFQFVVCYLVCATALIYFLLPVAAVAVFGYMLYMTYGLYSDLEKLKIAVALMSQIDYNRFVADDLLSPPEPPDLSIYDEEMQERLTELASVDTGRDIALREVSSMNTDVSKVCSALTMEVIDQYKDVKMAMNERLKEIQDKIAEYMNTYKPFPTVCNTSAVMSHDYVLGQIENKLDVRATLPLCNIVFDCKDRAKAVNMMKLYLCNAILSVQVKKLVVDIYDPKSQGREFAEFFDTETSDYIKPNEQTLDKLMEDFRKYAQDNIKKLNHRSIDDFNRDAEEKGMITLPYRLLIMISEFDKWKKTSEETGRVFSEFFKYSAENGVMIWIMDTKRWAGSVWVDGSYNSEEGHALEYDIVLGTKAVETFTTTLKAYKPGGISYLKNFAERYIPRDKWWTWNTVEGIDLNFGLVEGDPSKGDPIQLNDGNVHCLCVGATGAGKSALISILITSLITKYPPSELEIIYIDFKNSEASKLTRDGISIVPHFKIISGTTDGGYALSIFEYLIDELTKRQVVCGKYKEVNLKDLRKRHPEVVIPRLLILFDEFQVMFNPEYVPPRIIDSISGKITAFTKLARAYGGHLLFTSQSMSGTLSSDTMANFSVRAALRCTSTISEQILGNKAAGTITEKFGYMYTNTSAGEDPKFNIRWRVPFIDVPEMMEVIGDLNTMCKETGEKHWLANFYDEKELMSIDRMIEWYDNYPDKFADGETLILGERAAYSTNRAPVTISLQQDTKENIMIGAFERADLLNLVLTVVKNIKRHEDTMLLMHVADKDSHQLLGVDDFVLPELYDISKPDQNVPEFIDAVNDMVLAREETGGPYSPVYVVCVGWENAQGIGTEQINRAAEKLRLLLNKAPVVGVHFIFAMKSKPMEPCSFITAACAHRIGALLPTDYLWFIDCIQCEKLPSHESGKGIFAMYKYGTTETKFRIYQNQFKGVIKSREVVIE